MNLEISKYLNEYIQNKFPMYYEAIGKAKIISFVNSIASSSLFKKQNKDKVLAGDVDSIIDKLVHEYARLKLPDIWQKNLFQYLSEYIQRKFPIYYNSISKDEFNSFVNSIASNTKLTDSGLDIILAGNTNKIIDELVEKYAQPQLTRVWANFGNLCNYVKNVIIQSPGVDVEIINKKTLDDIIKKIAEGFLKDNKDYSYYMNGAYDKIFLDSFDAHYDKVKKDCYQHVKNIVASSDIKSSYDKLTYEYLIEQVMIDILQYHDIEDIANGLCDDEILQKFILYSSEMKEKVESYLRTCINNMDFLTGIPVEEVVSHITKMVVVTGELSAVKILEGKMDQFIEGYADKKRKSNQTSLEKKKIADAKEHVRKKLKFFNSGVMPEDVLEQKADEIFGILYCNHRFSPREIQLGEHDDLINKLFSRMLMEYNSLKHRNTPKRVKHNPRKRKMQKTLPVLLVTVVLASSLYGGAMQIGQAINDFSNVLSSRKVDDFDGYHYSYIFTPDNDGVKPTALNVLDFYEKLKETGIENEDFYYLGFYRAYQAVRDDRLFIMDKMLSLVQGVASSEPKYAEFYSEVARDSCYLEFVMERLEAMGCEKITEQKYQDALKAYKNAMWDSSQKGTPMDKLSLEDIDVIEEIMDIYKEYSDKLVSQLANQLSSHYALLSGKAGGRV